MLEDRGRTPAVAATDDSSRAALVVELRSDLVRPRLIVVGELDLTSADLLAAMLDHVRRPSSRTSAASDRHVHVDVDLARVTFADSSGLAPVLDSGARVVAASGPVRRVLCLLGDEPLRASA